VLNTRRAAPGHRTTAVARRDREEAALEAAPSGPAGSTGRVAFAGLLLAAFLGMTGCTGTPPQEGPIATAPALIAHRGASGYRPEHTLAAYELAIAQGAHYIEPDLVMTKDRVLIARHEPLLASVDPATGALIEATTNVHTLAQYASRRTTRVIDGKPYTGWFAEDFTAAEIRTLRARERIPDLRPASAAWDDRFEIPTLQEVIDLAKRKSAELGRVIGIYPETKHPTYHHAAGLAMEDALVAVLAANGWNHAKAPVFIQSFEVGNLRYLRTITEVALVQLLNAGGRPYDFAVRGDPRTYADLASAAGLAGIAGYARGVGAHKNLIVPRTVAGTLGTPTTLVRDAHAAGLVVHGWTFRAENNFLPTEHRSGFAAGDRGDLSAEIAAFLATGMDGFFTDHPDVGAYVIATIGKR